jgi:hypothetical protein
LDSDRPIFVLDVPRAREVDMSTLHDVLRAHSDREIGEARRPQRPSFAQEVAESRALVAWSLYLLAGEAGRTIEITSTQEQELWGDICHIAKFDDVSAFDHAYKYAHMENVARNFVGGSVSYRVWDRELAPSQQKEFPGKRECRKTSTKKKKKKRASS